MLAAILSGGKPFAAWPGVISVTSRGKVKGTLGLIGLRHQIGQWSRITGGARVWAIRNGLKASGVTIQGEMVLAKFLARNGPSG